MPDLLSFAEFEAYWKDLRPARVDVQSTNSPVSIHLREVAEAFEKELPVALQKLRGKGEDDLMLTRNLSVAFSLFMGLWYEHMKHYDLGYLVEVIFEGQKDLSLEDVKGFIRALPMGVLQRILNENKGQMRGLHALCACEVKRRDRELGDYDLRLDSEKRLIVSFIPPVAQNPRREQLTFVLSELFGG